jgi:Predicted metal-dependent hydrolase of the TIM-barrel fold
MFIISEGETGMIIDFRLRPPYKSYLDAIMYRDLIRSKKMSERIGMYQAESVQKLDLELTLKEMREAGIDKGVVSGRKANPHVGMVNNAHVQELTERYPDYFIGLAGIDPFGGEDAIRELDDYVVNGNLKAAVIEPGVLPQPSFADDERFYYLYEYCEKHEIPVMMMIGGNGGKNINYSMPWQVEHVALDFPGLQIIVAHGGFPWITEMIQVAYHCRNVSLLPDLFMLNMPGAKQYATAANYILRDQMLFGSAYPFAPMKEAVECVERLGMNDEAKRRFFHDNAVRLLKLD